MEPIVFLCAYGCNAFVKSAVQAGWVEYLAAQHSVSWEDHLQCLMVGAAGFMEGLTHDRTCLYRLPPEW